jgi:hypothetical protein
MRALRSCVKRLRDGQPGAYSELWGMLNSTFCLPSAMFESLKKRLEPLLPAKRIWIQRREGRFVVFSCLKEGSRDAVRSLLQGAAAYARRRARVANAVGHHLPSHYRVLWEIQNGKCYFSGTSLGQCFEDRAFCVDHLSPLAVKSPPFDGIAGTNWPINLALVTKRVNSMKGGDDAETFLWRVQHQSERYSNPFTPTPRQERARIDRLRRKRFAAYMQQHCKDELDYR